MIKREIPPYPMRWALFHYRWRHGRIQRQVDSWFRAHQADVARAHADVERVMREHDERARADQAAGVEPRFVILDRPGGYLIAWRSLLRQQGAPVYVYRDANLYPTEEAAQAAIDKYLNAIPAA